MKGLYLSVATVVLLLSGPTMVLACGKGDPDPPSAPQPVQQYTPQPTPSPDEGLRLAGTGLGSAIVAASIAWSLARRKA